MQVNINTLLDEIASLKELLSAAQGRLAALESLLQQAQAQEQQAQVPQLQQPVQPGPQAPQLQQPVQQAQPEQTEDFDYEGDLELALKIMSLIATNGEMRISSLRWRLSFEHNIRCSEAEVIHEVKALERLGALKGMWFAPGVISRSAPVLDPRVSRGPEFVNVRRRLEDLLSKRR